MRCPALHQRVPLFCRTATRPPTDAFRDAAGGQLLIVERDSDSSLLTKAWDVAHRWVIRDHVAFHSGPSLLSWVGEAGFVGARQLARQRRLFWKGKLYSSLAVMEAKLPMEGSPS